MRLHRLTFVVAIVRRFRRGSAPLGGWSFAFWFSCAFALVFQYLATWTKPGDDDRWWSLVVGRNILAEHAVRTTLGPQSLHPGLVWPDHEWLYCLATALFADGRMYWIFAAAHGVALAVAVFFVLGECVRERVSPFWTTFLVGAVGKALADWEQLRAEAFVPALLVAVVLGSRSRSRIGPPIVVGAVIIWANWHGSYPLALLYLASRSTSRLRIATFFTAIVATLCNPMGFGSWTSVASFPYATIGRYIAEWFPSYSMVIAIGQIFSFLLPGLLCAVWGSPRRWKFSAYRLAFPTFTLVMALRSVRFMKTLGVFGAPALAGLFRERRPIRSGLAWAAAIPFVLGTAVPVMGSLLGRDGGRDLAFGLATAVGSYDAERWAFRLGPTACFDDDSFGSVFEGMGGRANMDGRIDAFPERAIAEQNRFSGDDAMARSFARETCAVAVISGSSADPAMRRAGWHLARTRTTYGLHGRYEIWTRGRNWRGIPS